MVDTTRSARPRRTPSAPVAGVPAPGSPAPGAAAPGAAAPGAAAPGAAAPGPGGVERGRTGGPDPVRSMRTGGPDPGDEDPRAHRRLYRSADDRLLGGVARGLAEHLDLDPLAVRIGFAVLAAIGGGGAVLYVVFWAVLPLRPASPPGGSAGGSSASDGSTARGSGRGSAAAGSAGDRRVQVLALLALGLGALLLGPVLGVGLGSGVLWPAVAAGGGLALVWRQADDRQRERWTGRLAPGRSGPAWLRVVAGLLLFVGGLLGFLAAGGELAEATGGLLAGLVLVAGLALLSGPWWVRLTNDLREERRERIRSQERAELAAQVHDSVLHTLALIQRQADDPREVSRLARAQERELRGWLYRPVASPSSRYAAAVEEAAAEVEDRHGVPVEVVVVGDCDLDDHLRALVSAAREAAVNAAKHSGATSVSLYTEVEPHTVTAYVRDRGSGFDPAAVPADRLGLAESVVGRMARHGGSAQVRTGPGEGTEVALEMKRP